MKKALCTFYIYWSTVPFMSSHVIITAYVGSTVLLYNFHYVLFRSLDLNTIIIIVI